MTTPDRPRRIARRLAYAAALLIYGYGVIAYMVAAAFWSFVG